MKKPIKRIYALTEEQSKDLENILYNYERMRTREMDKEIQERGKSRQKTEPFIKEHIKEKEMIRVVKAEISHGYKTPEQVLHSICTGISTRFVFSEHFEKKGK